MAEEEVGISGDCGGDVEEEEEEEEEETMPLNGAADSQEHSRD